MALMEAASASGEAVIYNRVAGISTLAVDVASMSEAEIQARLADLSAREAAITDVIDVHMSGSRNEGLHIGVTASGAVVAPLSGPRAVS